VLSEGDSWTTTSLEMIVSPETTPPSMKGAVVTMPVAIGTDIIGVEAIGAVFITGA